MIYDCPQSNKSEFYEASTLTEEEFQETPIINWDVHLVGEQATNTVILAVISLIEALLLAYLGYKFHQAAILWVQRYLILVHRYLIIQVILGNIILIDALPLSYLGYKYHQAAILWVNRPLILWIIQVILAVISLIEALLLSYLGYKYHREAILWVQRSLILWIMHVCKWCRGGRSVDIGAYA
uniref:Uncharacterized protein n=1 Tax=Timema shepardi TaxID=629360 RepID=A0A7R9AK14_TIMSH|nr:unnamed protein product [Timema shepardi]